MIIKKAVMLLAIVGMLAFVALDAANSRDKKDKQSEYIKQQNTTIKITTKLH